MTKYLKAWHSFIWPYAAAAGFGAFWSRVKVNGEQKFIRNGDLCLKERFKSAALFSIGVYFLPVTLPSVIIFKEIKWKSDVKLSGKLRWPSMFGLKDEC